MNYSMKITPQDHEFTLLLSFDLDGESAEVRKGEDPVTISRGRYGVKVGIWRILDLLDKYGVKTTFFVPGWIAEKYPDIVLEVHRRGHEIAQHGYMHERLDRLVFDEELRVFDLAEKSISKVIGVRPLGFRAPYWRFSYNTLNILVSRGYLYDSSLMDQDEPYTIRIDNRVIVELPVDWRLDDWPYLEISRTTPREVLDMWLEEINYAWRRRSYISLTFHPQCIGRGARILILEKILFEALKRKAWIPRAIDLAKRVIASTK